MEIVMKLNEMMHGLKRKLQEVEEGYGGYIGVSSQRGLYYLNDLLNVRLDNHENNFPALENSITSNGYYRGWDHNGYMISIFTLTKFCDYVQPIIVNNDGGYIRYNGSRKLMFFPIDKKSYDRERYNGSGMNTVVWSYDDFINEANAVYEKAHSSIRLVRHYTDEN